MSSGIWAILFGMTAVQRSSIAYADYLRQEEVSDVRHEFLHGEIFAMAGGTLEHSLIGVAVTSELRAKLGESGCRVFSSDARLRHEKNDFSCYPDAMVVCGEIVRAGDDVNAVTNPVLIVEVLSDSTEAHDRGAKASHYRSIASLKELVFVSQNEPHVEVHRRNSAGRFELFEWRAGETIQLASIGISISLDSLYRDVDGA